MNNDFSDDQSQQEQPIEAVVVQSSALEAIIGKEFDVAIATAKKFPRDLAKSKKQTLQLAAADKETAESCFFTLKRKKKKENGGFEEVNIEGESIRLAEIVATSWGNLKYASRIISIDKIGKKITAQAVVHDLENNISASYEETKNISTSSGKLYSEDMIVMTGRAAQSVAMRNAIFKVVPKAFFRQIIKDIQQVAIGERPGFLEDQKNFKKEPLAERIKKAVKFFTNWGISEDRIFSAIGVKSMDEMTEEHLITLTGMRSGINQGEISLSEAFPMTDADKSDQVGKNIVDKLKNKDTTQNKIESALHSGFTELNPGEFIFQVINPGPMDNKKKYMVSFDDGSVGKVKSFSWVADDIAEITAIPVKKDAPFTNNTPGSFVKIVG